MRIAMISMHTSPLARLGGKEAGGLNVYVRELARKLGHRGVAVDIFTRQQDQASPFVLPLGDGVRLITIPAGPTTPCDKNTLLDYIPTFVHQICTFAIEQRLSYDVLHSHYWLSGEVALQLRDEWDAPVIQMFHTLGAMKNSVARSDDEREHAPRIAIERQLLHEADAVVAATPLDRAQMVWHYGADPDHITVIPCGVDLHHFRPRPQRMAREQLGIPLSHRLLLGIGRMEPLKGFDILIQALALLHDRSPEWRDHLRVMLIGGGDEATPSEWNAEQHHLADLREEYGVRDAVTFSGARPHHDLPTYYNAADIFTMPSFYESFGMAALEACACGVPVVASDVGGLSHIIENGKSGMLVPPANPEHLANHIEHILTDDSLRRSLARESRLHTLNYGWSHIACRIQHLYDVLTEGCVTPCPDAHDVGHLATAT